jgi:hypothetical protein
MLYRVEVEYWQVEVFEVEAETEGGAREEALAQPFKDLIGGRFKVLDCRPAVDKVPCGVCGRPMDPLYPCHCEKHGCAMRDGLCDDCIAEDVAENGPI